MGKLWTALLGGTAVLFAGTLVQAGSAADLSPRLVVDGWLDDWLDEDAFFPACPAGTVTPCIIEPHDDSTWSTLQDIQQLYVTWDATHLYIAVSGSITGHALLVLLDHRDGGLDDMGSLEDWRRAVRFGPALRPDAFLAVRDGQRLPELWLVAAQEALQRVASDEYQAAASFAVGAPSGALEAAIPWSLLFPDAVLAVNPDSLAPAAPMFVLPQDVAVRGLRLAALVAHASEGNSGADAAPDPTEKLPLDPATPLRLDRAARVDWGDGGTPAFVRFGFAVQEQRELRFDPAFTSASATADFEIELTTFRAGDAAQRSTRLVVPDRDEAVQFELRVRGTLPGVLYLTSSIWSLHGERIVELGRDLPCTGSPCIIAASASQWDGRDAAGNVVRGGTYVLRVTAGTAPGTQAARVQRALAVVH